jgi:hypothetical protein
MSRARTWRLGPQAARASSAIIADSTSMPEARQNASKLADVLASASTSIACDGIAVDMLCTFMALRCSPFVESTLRAYRLKASNAVYLFSTFGGAIPGPEYGGNCDAAR